MFKKNLPYIIAEIASAHEGNVNLAIEITNYAIASKADAVKFQMFKSERLLSKNNPFFKKFTSKFAVASKDIKKGEKITKNNVIFKRTNQIGISQNDFALFTGKKISKDKLYDEMIYPKEIK